MAPRKSTLQVTRDGPSWRFAWRPHGGAAEEFVADEPPGLDGLVERLKIAVNDAAVHPTALRDLLAAVPVPPDVVQRARAFAAGQPGDPALLLLAAEPPLSLMPWELLPALWGAPELRVVRQLGATGTRGQPRANAQEERALVIVCDPPDGRVDPEVRRECEALVALLVSLQFKCTLLRDPTLARVESECSTRKPDIIHLIGHGRFRDGRYELRFSPAAAGAQPWLAVETVAAALVGAHRPELVYFDVRGSGLDAGRAVAGLSPDTLVLGWYGSVLSATAADVAMTLYSRMRVRDDGQLAALSTTAGRPDAVLVASLGRPDRFDRAWPAKFKAMRSPGDPLTIDLGLVPAICPAMLINGQSPIRRLCIMAELKRSYRVHVSCDTGISGSAWSETVELEHGANSWPVDHFKFPALHELTARASTRRQVSFTVSVLDGAKVVAELTRSTTYLSPIEWLDDTGAWPYLPSYVLPDSRGAKKVIARAIARLRRSDGRSFDGRAQDEALDGQVEALYEALREDLPLEYVSIPGAPVYVLDPGAAAEPPAIASAGQRVRFPREVLRYGRGTCHDLALLFAACAEHVGIRPLLVLIPGHTLFGYWRRPGAHRRFWEERRADSTRERYLGDLWSFRDLSLLFGQLETGAIRLVETVAATRLGGRTSFAEACSRGLDHFARHGRPLSCTIDVWAARAHVEPLYRAWTQE